MDLSIYHLAAPDSVDVDFTDAKMCEELGEIGPYTVRLYYQTAFQDIDLIECAAGIGAMVERRGRQCCLVITDTAAGFIRRTNPSVFPPMFPPVSARVFVLNRILNHVHSICVSAKRTGRTEMTVADALSSATHEEI